MKKGAKETSLVNLHQFLVACPRLTRRLVLKLLIVVAYCIVVAFISWWFNVPSFQWEAEATLLNGFILTLLLGFRNRTAFDRWWEARKLWGELTNNTRNLAWKLKSYLPAEVLAKARVPAALAGFAEALKEHLRGGARLQDIPGFETDPNTPAHVPLHLAGQIINQVAVWQRAGLIEGTTALLLDPHTRALLDVCGACERIRHTEIATFYKLLLWLGIALNIALAPWYTLSAFGFWSIIPFLVGCYFLLGIEMIDSDVEEPFGTEVSDLDLDRYCRTIRQAVTVILVEDSLPKAAVHAPPVPLENY